MEDYNKSVGYLNKGNYKKAMQLLKKCGEFKEVYVNLGNCYRAFGQDSKMIEHYKKALDERVPYLDTSLSGRYPTALNNLGLAYYMRGDDASAISCYKEAITIAPNFWDCHWNYSTAVLRQASSGHMDFKFGWELYSARLIKKTNPVTLRNDSADLVFWDQVSSGKSIVVLYEQGIGDAFMWGRYLSLLPFEEVYIQCSPDLDVVFSPEYKTVRMPSECPPGTVGIPMCSLSKCFSDIPAGEWLHDKFNSRNFVDKEKLNIGIVWDGSPTHSNNHNRSVTLHRFNRLSKYANLHALVPGDFKTTKHVSGLGIKSWKDTAECINGLDIIITIDTSVAHLAGSLGAEVWLLQPLKETDFRWGNGVTRSVWYSSVQIFNNPGSWDFVFDSVEEALKDRLYLC